MKINCPICKNSQKVIFKGFRKADHKKIYYCKKKNDHINNKPCYFSEEGDILIEDELRRIRYINCPVCSKHEFLIIHQTDKYLKCKNKSEHEDKPYVFIQLNETIREPLKEFLKKQKCENDLKLEKFRKCYQKYQRKRKLKSYTKIETSDEDILYCYFKLHLPYELIVKLFSTSTSTIKRICKSYLF